MKMSFSQKHPYWAAIFSGILCTMLTTLGTAIPQIIGLEEIPTIIVMTITVAVSAVIGMLIMVKSRFQFPHTDFISVFLKISIKSGSIFRLL